MADQAPLTSEPRGFHLREGLFFCRKADGHVAIQKYRPGALGPEWVLVVPPNEWASVVASVCARGENIDTFTEAMEFHGAPEV